ncbi:MAG: LacI family transcriptional regulator [Rubrobacteraceae bacterium]|nr:LacI family DNA-binding transcriptional regulator [Rubrobacteraceae bacterium]MCL6438825.1 LacI family transcriptional regulator [Rubrobacteraceae bacterium]
MKRITIADVAREAGVSTQTVSRVLNNKAEISTSTRETVMRVIERLGYRPSGVARGLATSKTLTVGLVVPDIANPFFPEIARGAEDLLRRQGYEMFLCNTVEDPERERAVLGALEEKRVDGVVICSSRLPDEQLFPHLRRQRAVVLVNRSAPEELAGTVCVDDAFGTEQAVNHLLASGCRVIGFLAGPPRSHSGRERAKGFERALRIEGYKPDPGLIIHCSPNHEGGYDAALSLLSARPDIDGLICYNDLVAVGALRACAQLGRKIPEEVAVVGCDDIMIAGLVSPALTTLRVSKYELGTMAARLLLDRIEGRREHSKAKLRPELVVRSSTLADDVV